MEKVEKATYNYNAVRECWKKVHKTAATVKVKSQHGWKCCEIERLFDECCDKTGCFLFDAEYSIWEEYSELVNSKGSLKKDMDMALKSYCRFLLRELDAILEDMDDGVVNATV